jgi:hypothetical protein
MWVSLPWKGVLVSYQFPHSSPEGPEAPVEGDPAVKQTKDEANYRPAGSSETNCGSCGHYLGDGICEVVAGTVSTKGVSDNWTPRKKSMTDLVQ